MIKLSINKRSISLVIIALLGSFYLQTSCAAPREAKLEMLILSNRISLLEQEIKLLKIKQNKIQDLSPKVLKVEQDLKSLQNYIKQDAIYVTTRTAYPKKPKVNFFVPAGW